MDCWNFSELKAKAMLVERVKQHYCDLWGEPSRTAHFTIMGKETNVLKWDADLNPERVFLYVTAGLSEYQLAEYDPTHRLELFTGLIPAKDAICQSPVNACA